MIPHYALCVCDISVLFSADHNDDLAHLPNISKLIKRLNYKINMK